MTSETQFRIFSARRNLISWAVTPAVKGFPTIPRPGYGATRSLSGCPAACSDLRGPLADLNEVDSWWRDVVAHYQYVPCEHRPFVRPLPVQISLTWWPTNDSCTTELAREPPSCGRGRSAWQCRFQVSPDSGFNGQTTARSPTTKRCGATAGDLFTTEQTAAARVPSTRAGAYLDWSRNFLPQRRSGFPCEHPSTRPLGPGRAAALVFIPRNVTGVHLMRSLLAL
jgi:hypothetical protein